MDRRARADSLTPLLMPEGDVIAGVFDRKTSDAVALTRPVRVQRERVTYVSPAPPKGGSDVLAVLDRPGIRPRSQTEDAVVEAPPLVVRTETSTGDPAELARAGMWFGPYRMTTMFLGFLTWSQTGLASREGVWIARGLPAAPARMFVWRKNTATAIAGGFDALATTIRHPWGEVITLRAVD